MLIAFFVLFIGIGLTMLGFAAHSWWKSRQVDAWPATEGVMVERAIKEDHDSDGTTYRVDVRYTYTVAGRHYEADRLAFGYAGSSAFDTHRAIYDKLMRGDRVQVRYNPANHAESALAHGLNTSTIIMLVFGTVWTCFTIGLMVLFHLNSRGDTTLIERLIVR